MPQNQSYTPKNETQISVDGISFAGGQAIELTTDVVRLCRTGNLLTFVRKKTVKQAETGAD